MAKRTITKWLLFAAVALAGSAILVIADGVALAAHLAALPVGRGQGLAPDAFSRNMLVLIVLGVSIAAIGVVAELVAWVGAVANTHGLADRRWFTALLWSGVVGILALPIFGLGALITGSAMLAYLVGGPDRDATGRSQQAAASPRQTIWSKPAILRWATWGLLPIGSGPTVALVVANQTNPGGLLQGHTWTALVLLTTCAIVVLAGVIIESVAWWAAMFNARRLADQTWFNRLAWSGIAAALTMPLLGLGAVIAIGVGVAYRNGAADALASDEALTRRHAATA